MEEEFKIKKAIKMKLFKMIESFSSFFIALNHKKIYNSSKNGGRMYLIVGLGNPEPEYSKTRHNMGFDVINKLAEKYNSMRFKNKFNSEYSEININGEKIHLLKPQTYMNLSGKAVIEIMNYLKIKKEELIVVFDDIDIDEEKIKIKKKGTAGTHNGMKSVINEIRTEEFIRVKVGVGRPEYKGMLADYVLEKLNSEKYSKLEKGIDKAVKAVEDIIKKGVDSAMNLNN